MSDDLDKPLLTFEPPFNMYHVTGGVLVMVDDLGTTMLGSAGAPVFFSQLNPKTMLNLFAKQQPLRILGKSHLSHADEMNEVVQQHFATSIINSKGSCSSSSQADHWQGVGNSYRAENNIREYLYSKRLSSQIRFVQNRLERLSIAYRTSISFLKLQAHFFSNILINRCLSQIN